MFVQKLEKSRFKYILGTYYIIDTYTILILHCILYIIFLYIITFKLFNVLKKSTSMLFQYNMVIFLVKSKEYLERRFVTI